MTSGPLLEAYRTLLVLSRRQVASLAALEIDDFLDAMGEREKVFGTLQSLEGAMAHLTAAERQALNELIPEILKADQEIEASVNRLRNQTEGELQTLQTGLSALHSYLPQGESASLFIDKSS